MNTLEISDIERIVRLVADAGDPTVEISLAERKRHLLEGVARLVNADAWIWSTAVPNPDVPGDITTTCVVDGGWNDGQEQGRVYQALTDHVQMKDLNDPILEAARKGQHVTLLRQDLVSEEVWSKVGPFWRRTGFDHVLLVVHPMNRDVFSGVAFHRRCGKPNYVERDRAIVHVVFRQVEWLHRHGTNTAAQGIVVHLSPRERQVLTLLLSGDSRKEVAKKLRISEHTVGDYMKQLHKHFAVNSRAELQAYFLIGGKPE